MEPWIGLVGVALGSLMSIIGVALSNRSSFRQLQIQLNQERLFHTRDLARERLEELYILISAWLTKISSHYLSLSMVMQGKLTYDQHNDLSVNGKDSPAYDFNRLEMIMSVYAEPALNEYQAVLNARTKLNEISKRHYHVYLNGDDNRHELLKPYVSAQIDFEKCGEVLKTKISELAKNA